MKRTIADQHSTPLDDAGKLVLRLAVGVLILLHGIAKIPDGHAFVGSMLGNFGLPAAFGYLVYIGEVVAPILLIIGLWTRLAALVVCINMVAAIGLVHMHELAALTDNGGWALELQGMYLFGALAITLLGAGRMSVGGVSGRFN